VPSTVQINSFLAVLTAMNIDIQFSGPLSAAFKKVAASDQHCVPLLFGSKKSTVGG
jgi:hypothetical protein